MILGVIILNGCLETTSYNPQNNFTIPEEELGKKAFQYYENWILDSKKISELPQNLPPFIPSGNRLFILTAQI